MITVRNAGIVGLIMCVVSRLPCQQPISQDTVSMKNDSISVRLVDVDLRSAAQALGRYLDRSLIIGKLPEGRVTLETPHPVPRRDVPRLLKGLVESQNVDMLLDTLANVYRLAQRDAQRPPTQAPPPGQTTSPDLFVIRLKHAKASEAAATINALYGRASAFGESGLRQSQTLSRELTQSQIPPNGAPLPGAPNGTVATGARLSGEVTIVPDARANTLLIRASRNDYALIQAAVAEIDVRPPQVLIEVTIAEINLSRSFDFGVSVSVPQTDLNKGTTTITGTTSGAASAGDLIVQIMGIGGTLTQATIEAAASRGDATIISKPVILAANNESAEINVGSQRPFVQLSRVLATDNSARDQVVQYKDVGTKLRVIPTISADDYVMLQVTQEVNAATAEQAFDAPVISTRSIDTRLLVKDTQTIVLGGLSDRQRDAAQNGIPLLSNLPLIGGLFGHVSRQSEQTELYIFLTPRIIRGDADVDRLTKPLQEKMERASHE